MNRKETNGYYELLGLLVEHPEFNFLTDNPCDAEITALGSKLWKEWEQDEFKTTMKRRFNDLLGNMPEDIFDKLVQKSVHEDTLMVIEGLASGRDLVIIADAMEMHLRSVVRVARDYGFDIDPMYTHSKVLEIEAGRVYKKKKEKYPDELFTDCLDKYGSIKEMADATEIPVEKLRYQLRSRGIRFPKDVKTLRDFSDRPLPADFILEKYGKPADFPTDKDFLLNIPMEVIRQVVVDTPKQKEAARIFGVTDGNFGYFMKRHMGTTYTKLRQEVTA